MVQQALKFFAHTKWLSRVLASPLPSRRMSQSQQSLSDVAFECVTLQSGAMSCNGQPHWRLQTHRGMNSNRLCVRWWQREASQKTASTQSFHLSDVSKSPTSHKYSCAEITGRRGLCQKQRTTEPPHSASVRIVDALPDYTLHVSHPFVECEPCVLFGRLFILV